MDRYYSFIVPVYNRPGELAELLESIALQTYAGFEVVVIEDGSDLRSDLVVREFSGRLEIVYCDLPRSGPSLARNAGTAAAKGDYYIYVDSDCLLPADYLDTVNRSLDFRSVDFFGGPDRASENFNLTQKAISYAMTSFLTTGGIRGGRKQIDRFYPRSFNMGVSRKAFEAVGGFPITRMHPGEDMVFSIELVDKGFAAGLIRDAYVFHKRRTTLPGFFKQVSGFGKTRLIISRVYPHTFSLFYLAPSFFLAGSAVLVALAAVIGLWALLPLLAWTCAVFADATFRIRSIIGGSIAVIASFIQLYGYGSGYLGAWWSASVRGNDRYGVFSKGFYPGRL